MYNEKLFTYFKVFENIAGKILTEMEMRQLAIDHFNDLVETFDLPNGSYMEMYEETRTKGRKKVFHYRVVQGFLPRSIENH